MAHSLYSQDASLYHPVAGIFLGSAQSTSLSVGNYFVLSGLHTNAQSDFSSAFGLGTWATTNFGIAAGRYNVRDPANLNNVLFVIGNGTDDQHRSDAFRVYENGDVYLGNNITISADNFNLDSIGDLTVHSNLTVLGQTFIANLSITGSEFANSSFVGVSTMQEIHVTDFSVFGGNITVIGASLFNNTIAILGDAFAQSNVLIQGNLVTQGDTILNTLSVYNTTALYGDTFILGNTGVFGNVLFIDTSAFTVVPPALFLANVSVEGSTLLDNNVSITGDVSASSNVLIQGNLVVQGQSYLNNTLTVSQDVFAQSNVLIQDNLVVQGQSYLNNSLTVSGTSRPKRWAW